MADVNPVDFPAAGAVTMTSDKIALNQGGVWKIATIAQALGYAAGTWDPVFTCATAGDLNVSYTPTTGQLGSYTKIGNMVFIVFRVTGTFSHTSASGSIRLTGLPFTASNAQPTLHNLGTVDLQYVTKAGYTCFLSRVSTNQSFVDFRATGSGVANANIDLADLTGNSFFLLGRVTYNV